MNRRIIFFLTGLFISLYFLIQGITMEQFIETGTNGSLLCLFCIGIG